MKKKQIFLSAMLVLMSTGAANAQKAFTYVQQNGVKIDNLGTAAFRLEPGSHHTVEFDENGKAVMRIGDNIVASQTVKYKGQLCVEFKTNVAAGDLNKVTKTFTNEYATLYSPFQLQVPESGTVEVYAPTYNATAHAVSCNSSTQVAAGAVIPAETALLLKNAGTFGFAISAGASTDTHVSALSGSSLVIDKPAVESSNTLYTLGHEASDPSKYGFFQYTGAKLNPGLAWLVAPSLTSAEAKYYAISFDDEVAGLSELREESLELSDGKFFDNGRVVIVKNGKKYNLNGQEIK